MQGFLQKMPKKMGLVPEFGSNPMSTAHRIQSIPLVGEGHCPSRNVKCSHAYRYSHVFTQSEHHISSICYRLREGQCPSPTVVCFFPNHMTEYKNGVPYCDSHKNRASVKIFPPCILCSFHRMDIFSTDSMGHCSEKIAAWRRFIEIVNFL